MVKYSDGLDTVASALAHRGRRQIVATLRTGPATSSQLAAQLQIGLPALDKHLGLMRRAEIIESAKSGRVVTHRLQTDQLTAYADWMLTRSTFWTNQLDNLAKHLEQQ